MQLTLLIAVISIAFGFIGGILIGMGRISRNRLIYGLSTVYVEAFRGTPLLIQIFLVYLGLPQIGHIRLQPSGGRSHRPFPEQRRLSG